MSAGTAIILSTRDERFGAAVAAQAEAAAVLKQQGLALEVKNGGEHWIVREGKRIVVQWWPSTAKITPGETWRRSERRGTIAEFVAFVGQTLREERNHPPIILPKNQKGLRPIKHRGQIAGYAKDLGGSWSPLDANRKVLAAPIRKVADCARFICEVAASQPCSKCGVRPTHACGYCGVILCDEHGKQHDPPDCPPMFEAYERELAAMAAFSPGAWTPSAEDIADVQVLASPDQLGPIAPWDYSTAPDPATAVPNMPTEAGRQLGELLAKLADEAEAEQQRDFPDMIPRCNDCAFRAGTRPNGCEETLMDAIKCAVEARPFYCHKGTQDGAMVPTRLCSGAMVLYQGKTAERLRQIVGLSGDPRVVEVARQLDRVAEDERALDPFMGSGSTIVDFLGSPLAAVKPSQGPLRPEDIVTTRPAIRLSPEGEIAAVDVGTGERTVLDRQVGKRYAEIAGDAIAAFLACPEAQAAARAPEPESCERCGSNVEADGHCATCEDEFNPPGDSGPVDEEDPDGPVLCGGVVLVPPEDDTYPEGDPL